MAEEESNTIMRDQHTQTQRYFIRNYKFLNVTLRDILKFIFNLLLPLMLGVYAVINAAQVQNRAEQQFAEDRLTAELQRNLERNLSEERYQNELFDTYIKEMGILMKENNGTLTSNVVIWTLARGKTLHVFRRLDSYRNVRIIQYLYEAEQLSETLERSSLDLSTAQLHHIDFRQSAVNKKYMNRFSLAGVFLFDSIFINMQIENFNLSQNYFNTANFSSITLRKGDFRYAFMKNVDLSYAHIENVDFSHLELLNSNFSFSKLFNVNFSSSKLTNVDFSMSHLENVQFSFSEFHNVNFSSSYLGDTNFTLSKLHYVDFSSNQINYIDLKNTTFFSTELKYVNFSFTTMYRATFHRSQHTNSIFFSSILVLSRFDLAEMPRTNFERARCANIIFSNANLSYSTFSYANAKYARFHTVNLHKVNFSFTNLQKTFLLYTNVVVDQLQSAISFRDAEINTTLNVYEPSLIQNGEANCNISLIKHWTLQMGQIKVEISKENTSNCYFALQSYDIGAIMFQSIDIPNKWDFDSWPRSQIVLSGNMSMGVSIELRQINSRQEIHSQRYLNSNGKSVSLELFRDIRELQVLIEFNASINQNNDTRNWCDNIDLFIEYGANSELLQAYPTIPRNARWSQKGVTILKGNTYCNDSKFLIEPWGLHLEDEKSLLIADRYGHQIFEWTFETSTSTIVAGGNGQGKQTNQFDEPSDVRIDKVTDTLIICDTMNRRVMQWPRRNGINGEIMIDKIACTGLAMDDHRFLYISSYLTHDIKRYRIGDAVGIVVAGNNGKGDHLNQLNLPSYIFIDKDYSIYISDTLNHRIMKWNPGAQEGIVVAGSTTYSYVFGNLRFPQGLFVDQSETVYISDWKNRRIVRWNHHESIIDVIIHGNAIQNDSNKPLSPTGLAFDRHGNLYIADSGNCRILRFDFEGT